MRTPLEPSTPEASPDCCQLKDSEHFVQFYEEDSFVVVVLTSSEEPGDVHKAYKFGTNSYLVKPPTAEQLTEMAKAFNWYWLDYNRFAKA